MPEAMSTSASAVAARGAAPGWRLAPYLEFSRVGFVNILAFRLRYYTGILTYLINVTVYYFIWRAVYGPSSGATLAGYDLPQMVTYVSVGWIIRSFYWNTIDQEMAYEVLEGKIAMELIKPVSVQGMWLPLEHIAFTPLQIYLGKLSAPQAARALLAQWAWVVALLWLADRWWRVATRKITIQGG